MNAITIPSASAYRVVDHTYDVVVVVVVVVVWSDPLKVIHSE